MKSHVIVGLCTFGLMITSCGEASKLAPDGGIALAVSSSPSLSIAKCEPITVKDFTSVNTISTSIGDFTLLGVDPIETIRDIGTNQFFQKMKNDAVCYKSDPSVSDKSIYLFGPNEVLINGEIIRNGYATASINEDYLYKLYFIKLENDAEKNVVGLWKEQGISKNTSGEFPVAKIEDVQKSIGKEVSVEIMVKSVAKGKTAIYLNSQLNYKDPSNIAIIIPLPLPSDSLKLLSQTYPDLVGKKIIISGRVTESGGKPIMKVFSIGQLRMGQ